MYTPQYSGQLIYNCSNNSVIVFEIGYFLMLVLTALFFVAVISLVVLSIVRTRRKHKIHMQINKNIIQHNNMRDATHATNEGE